MEREPVPENDLSLNLNAQSLVVDRNVVPTIHSGATSNRVARTLHLIGGVWNLGGRASGFGLWIAIA